MQQIFNEFYPDLTVLGSTGSVGEQALDVARAHRIRVRGVMAHRSTAAIEAQIREFHPDFAVLTDEQAAWDLRARVVDTDTKVLAGFEGVTEMLHSLNTENPLGVTVENSIVGIKVYNKCKSLSTQEPHADKNFYLLFKILV